MPLDEKSMTSNLFSITICLRSKPVIELRNVLIIDFLSDLVWPLSEGRGEVS